MVSDFLRVILLGEMLHSTCFVLLLQNGFLLVLGHGSPLIIEYYFSISVTLLVFGVVPLAVDSFLFLDHSLLLHVFLRAVGSHSQRVILLFTALLPGPSPLNFIYLTILTVIKINLLRGPRGSYARCLSIQQPRSIY